MFTTGTELTNPILIQIAADGKYEQALKLYPPFLDYAKDDVTELANNYTKNVAIEFFYETSDNRTSYFGVKYIPGSVPMNAEQFITRSIEAFARDQRFGHFVPALGKALNNDESTFLHTRPSRVELGVSEWWFTFGPLLIWTDGDPQLTQESLKDKLANREDLRINAKNFVGAEATFNLPIEHWLSTQVSKPYHDKYVLDTDQIMAITNSI